MHQHHPCTPCASGPNSPRRKEQTAEIIVEEAQSVLAEAEQKLKRADEIFEINSKKEEGVCTSSHTIESSHQSIRGSFPGGVLNLSQHAELKALAKDIVLAKQEMNCESLSLARKLAEALRGTVCA